MESEGACRRRAGCHASRSYTVPCGSYTVWFIYCAVCSERMTPPCRIPPDKPIPKTLPIFLPEPIPNYQITLARPRAVGALQHVKCSLCVCETNGTNSIDVLNENKKIVFQLILVGEEAVVCSGFHGWRLLFSNTRQGTSYQSASG